MQQAPLPTAARVQEVFEEVLAEREFAVGDTPPLVRLFNRIIDAVQRFLSRWMPDLGEEQVRVLAWLLLAGTVVLSALVVWRWISDRGPRRRTAAGGSVAHEAPRDAAGWVSFARSEAAAGHLREAATGLYQAVIRHLETEGAVRYGEWKTPGDYALEAGRDPDLRGPFRSFLSHFVALAFGPSEPTREGLDVLFARAERLGCRT